MSIHATYSPEDNKLRLRSATRLDADTYARVRAAGFIWAPKQQLFVAPMWTPGRADLLVALCDEIGDEDTSLVERAEERADRFDGYSEARERDGDTAHGAVTTIMHGIPLGQPILVGHHSERRARRDAERIDSGIRRAVKMWDTAKYWKARAEGAIRHAKYKELPAVRFRRIKGLEADRRRLERSYTPDARTAPQDWKGKRMVYVGGGNYRGGAWVDEARLPEIRQRAERWITHIDLRLTYERAMLGEAGKLAAQQNEPEAGGRVRIRSEWFTVLRVTRKAGQVVSVTTNDRYVPVRSIEEIAEVQAATTEAAAAVKTATKLPPMCNYPGADSLHMTKAEWTRTHRDYKGSRELGQGARRTSYRPDIAPGDGPVVGRHRVRTVIHQSRLRPVYLTDVKRVDPPAPAQTAEDTPSMPAPKRDIARETARLSAVNTARAERDADPLLAKLEAGRLAVKAGVVVVSAPQLFPTPMELSRRLVQLAGIQPGQFILEPSAGTGSLLRAIFGAIIDCDCARVVAVEESPALVRQLEEDRRLRLYANELNYRIVQGDFLLQTPEALGLFHRIVMNPPFATGADIRHIRHAYTFLRAGGRLAAICADGAGQQEALRPWALSLGGTYEPLPDGTFASSGTNVRTALLCVDRCAEAH